MSHRIYHFPPFSFDASSGTLQRSGHTLRLNNQTAKVLALLLDRHGNVVAREELQEQMWKDTVSVDFDKGINRAISNLRSCLRVNARGQRYIETLPKRGYRFCAPVTLQDVDEPKVFPAEALSPVASATPQLVALAPMLPPTISAQSGHVRRLPWSSVLASLVAIAASLILAWFVPFTRGIWLFDAKKQQLRPIYLDIRNAGPALSEAATQLGGTSDTVAYANYLQSATNIGSRNPVLIQKAIRLLEDAVRLDPGFAQAKGRLAFALLIENLYSDHPLPARESQALEIAKDVIQTNPAVSEAHGVVGFLAVHRDRNTALGESEYAQALRIDPNNPQIRSWFALLLSDEGRSEESLEQIRIARTQDKNSTCLKYNELLIYLNAGRFREMLAVAERNHAAYPDDPTFTSYLAWALWYNHQYVPSVKMWIKEANSDHDRQSASFEQTGLRLLTSQGPAAYAKAKAEALQPTKLSERNSIQRSIAEWYALAGEKQLALRALELSTKQHEVQLHMIKVDPAFTSLRGEERFQRIVHSLNLDSTPPAFTPYDNLHATSVHSQTVALTR
jgi:DNA-binding winged helix-turn-helix (wHTH) protein/Tfp pilus assembly protein PilF